MLKKILITAVLLITTSILAFSQSGSLKGVVTDGESGKVIPYANVVVEQGGAYVAGAPTDGSGTYLIKPLNPGTYDVKFSSIGYGAKVIQNVIIKSDIISFQDAVISKNEELLGTVVIEDYVVPLIEKDGGSSGGTATAKEIGRMPGRSAASVAVTVGGVFSQDGEVGSIRGSRSEGTVTYIDGVRVRGSSSLPKSALEQVTVITGGLPPQYGDATGGVINIVTKGASREFGFGVEAVTSQLLDNFGYNLLGFNLQGPLIKGDSLKALNSGTSLFGFFLSGEFSLIDDSSPSAIGYYQVKDDVYSDLKQNPLRPTGTGFGSYNNSDFLYADDFDKITAKSNSTGYSINLNAKLDVRTTQSTNLTFGGSWNKSSGHSYVYSYSLLNYDKMPVYSNDTWRVFGRFTHRIPNNPDNEDAFIKNVYYSIQADYTRYTATQADEAHGDNLFAYGHVGTFETMKAKSYELTTIDSLGYTTPIWVQNNNYDTLVKFTPSEYNPVVSEYTQSYYDLYDLYSGYYSNSTLIQSGGGLLNGSTVSSVYDLWTNTGAVYNGYAKSESEQIGVNARASFDLGNHAIQLGFQYEQRTDRYYSVSPVGLWTLARSITNLHISELDLSNPIPLMVGGVFQDTINFNRLYDEESQSYFDYNLRQALGLATDGLDWIDVDSYDPSTFSIDMFSADELLNNGSSYVNYYGYDHTGNKLTSNPSFDDFFTAVDEWGNKTRLIAPFEPIYMAGYISDKFAFKDLIFNVGVRVDRYDANQMVLDDPYLLYEAKTVAEVGAELGDMPESMGDDFIVYVNKADDPTAIKGYRNGSVWYNAQGVEISDPTDLEVNGSTIPYLIDFDHGDINSSAFTDYVPQITFMPRISFSFPISDEALFFAHYDVLSKRPTSGNRLDPTNYYFINTIGSSTINNPNLKPEKTIEYELGFHQKVGKRSVLKISAYYKEIRDLVQVYRYSGAYPVSYYSYNNIDFGTVKGLTISYDLRQTGNVWLKASYTLQFADGTGSTATSASAIVKSGQPNLRTTNPLSYDRRHGFTLVFDYRYSDGKNYNGPKWTRVVKSTDENGEVSERSKVVNLLANTGANITFRGGSGTPYSKSSKIVPLGSSSYILEGSLNGSRLPFNFNIDLRLDKDIFMTIGKNEEKGKQGRQAYFNIYLQVLNVLNTDNVIGVYRATGNADDDGYLAAAEYQTQIENQLDSESYINYYYMSVNSPYNYSLPRRIRLGVTFNF